MQKLLLQDITWDSILASEFLDEWAKICKQANAVPQISVPRSIGIRESTYDLIAFTDASKDAYGVVIYAKDLNTGQVSYLTSRSRLLSSKCQKTIPNLELQGVSYGAEILHATYLSLSGDEVVLPISINALHLFTDSTICIHWIMKYSIFFDKY